MRNLEAEMVRYGVSNSDICELLSCSEKTVRNKLNNDTEFTFPEAVKIRNKFFAGMKLEYLFATEEQAG